MSDQIEVVRKALSRAFSLGQTYWYEADSESYAANKRSVITRQKFDDLVEETTVALTAAMRPQ